MMQIIGDDVKSYSIMCDEATDVKNVSERVVCLR